MSILLLLRIIRLYFSHWLKVVDDNSGFTSCNNISYFKMSLYPISINYSRLILIDIEGKKEKGQRIEMKFYYKMKLLLTENCSYAKYKRYNFITFYSTLIYCYSFVIFLWPFHLANDLLKDKIKKKKVAILKIK